MLANEAFLDRLIQNHYKTARDMSVAVAVQVSVAIAIGVLIPSLGLDKLVGVLGGSIFGGLGFIPGKEILDQREKARNLEAARPLIQAFQHDSDAIDPTEQQRLKEILLKLMEETIKG